MTIPFLEVVYHTSNELSKQSKADVVRVTPQNLSLEEVLTNNNTKTVLWMTIKRLVLPITSLLTLIFWIISLIASYYSGGTEDFNMYDCLMIDLN